MKRCGYLALSAQTHLCWQSHVRKKKMQKFAELKYLVGPVILERQYKILPLIHRLSAEVLLSAKPYKYKADPCLQGAHSLLNGSK